MNSSSSDLRKWTKKRFKEEFPSVTDLSFDEDEDQFDIAPDTVHSTEVTDLADSVSEVLIEDDPEPSTSQPQTVSLDYGSDLSGDEWSIFKSASGDLRHVIEQLSRDKPDHVRLAGYEDLVTDDLTSLTGSAEWNDVLKVLRDGLTDSSRSVFEASLAAHTKLLDLPEYQDTFMNLLTAFDEQYQSKKLLDTLPTLLSGINFKIFLHERLIRILKVTIDHQGEVLKGMRVPDKSIEELIESFVTFLCPKPVANGVQARTLDTLNILSILEPQAGWTKKWMHNLATRKILCSVFGKLPTFMQSIIGCVKKGLAEPLTTLSVSICDEPMEVFISGESVETTTFFHALHLLSQLSSYATGRTFLSESQSEESFSLPDFMMALLSSLNILASSDVSKGVYEVFRSALKIIMFKPIILYDARFPNAALRPLMQPGAEMKMWPHTLDILNHMLNTQEGPSFLITDYRAGSASLRHKSSNYPVVTILKYASSLMRQPLSVMDIDHITELFSFIGNKFQEYRVFDIVQETMEKIFYPSLTYLYTKMDKYYVENESKTQSLDKAAKDMLLMIASVPPALQLLTHEPMVFEELIRGSITPLRSSWSSYDIVGFISNAAHLMCGFDVLSALAPHVLSTLISELCATLQNPEEFHDPWSSPNVETFLHVLAVLSINTTCFSAFMTTGNEKIDEEDDYPKNLHGLLQLCTDIDSPYHHLALLALNEMIWNLDVYIYSMSLFDFTNELLKLQNCSKYQCDENDELQTAYILDESSLIRHKILMESYYVRHKQNLLPTNVEDVQLFSEYPPPIGLDDEFRPRSASCSELSRFLEDNKPGLKDSSWVSQARKAHKASGNPMKNSVLSDLLDQMQKAIPTVDWVDRFKWETKSRQNRDYWQPEDMHGIELVLHYAERNRQLVDEKNEQAKENLKTFIRSAHEFINYKKSSNFEGFDWFLSTVFLICNGDLEKSKLFVSQFVRFPSAMFIWPALARVVDESNNEEADTRIVFAHLLEGIITHEFPTVKVALKSQCGINWWMICDRLISQCFWGILPWSEIVHYIAICILHSPDYILYYCTSLLNHCQNDLIEQVTKGKMWPESMVLEDFRCHSQIGFMDRLGKRFGGKLLPPLTQRKLNSAEES